MNKKILVLYTSIGMGHKFIAENISYHLKQNGYDVLLHDILQVQEGKLTAFGIWLHSLINRRLPFIWRWMYFSKFVTSIGEALRTPLAKSNSKNLEKIVNEFEPDAILCTQTTGSAATVALIEQNKFHGKFIIGFSDYHLHKLWIYNQADLFLVNTEEQKQEMINLKIPKNKIVVCGITLKPLQVVNSIELKQKLNIPKTDRVVIFGSGSLGIGFDYQLLKDFLKMFVAKSPDTTVVVMCGKNELLKDSLVAEKLSRVVPLGFFENPNQLYQIAELLVTKPGGLTVAEALQSNVRILVTHTLPGQEEPNYSYLLAKGLINPKPDILIARNLVDTALKVLSSSKPSISEESKKITQFGSEGKTLIDSVNNLFHIV